MYSARVNMENIKKDVIETFFQLDENYTVISGDHRVYQLLGDNTLYSFIKLIHPDDQKAFEEFFQSDELEEPLFARCLVKNGEFRWLLFYKMSTKENNLKRLVELKAQNIVAMSSNFDNYFMKMKKYRCALNMMKDKLFEYDFHTGFITIYCYNNDRSEIIEKDYLPDWEKRMIRLGFVEETAKEQFEMLCHNMEIGADSFSFTFETSIMSKGERKDTLNFRGQTLKEGSKKNIVMGMISELGSRMKEGQVLVSSEEGTKDSATGVLNKKTVQDEITEIVNKARTAESNELMYLLILDIDDFKKVNDTYGHYFGDEVILEFAQTLKQAVGSRGIVGRVGGDEFLALVKGIDSVDDLKAILKMVRKTLEVKLEAKQPGYHFTISAGASAFGKDADQFDELFKIADAALYIAKGKGKDRYIIYDKEKHGEFLQETLRNGHTVYSGGFMKPMEKYDMAVNLIMLAEQKGKDAIGEVLYELMDKLNIHGMTVYSGDSLRKQMAVGHYNSTIDDAGYILDDKYAETFDEYGVKKINNVASLAVDFPEVFRKFKEVNLCSSLQIKLMKNGKLVSMFQYDTFGENRRKWNDDDINVVRMVTKAIGDVLIQS